MKNAKKRAFTALVFIVIGLLLVGIALVKADFSLESLSNQIVIENTYEFEEDYDEIVINILDADVIFAHSEDGRTRVEIRETEKMSHSVQISENALQITARDARKWFDRLNFGISQTSVTVYLPENTYDSAFVLTHTGDISVPRGFFFETLDACTSTGKLMIEGVDSQNMILNGTTGKIILSDVDVQNELSAHMTTGKISIRSLKAQKMTASTTTGDIMLTDAAIEELMSVKVTTGDISFCRCDAGEVHMKATTGSIEGTFLTEKRFEAKATTGSVRVPDTRSGGLCRVTTTTGHIDISVGG